MLLTNTSQLSAQYTLGLSKCLECIHECLNVNAKMMYFFLLSQGSGAGCYFNVALL